MASIFSKARKESPMSGTTVTPYRDSWEQIHEELRLLDMRIRLQFYRQRSDYQDDSNQLRGLIISDAEVEALLAGKREEESGLDHLEAEVLEWEPVLRARTKITLENGGFLHLEHLSLAFNLNAFERNCLLLCLAVEWDRKYERIFAYLQDDVTCKHPTVDLALKLLTRTMAEKMAARNSFTMDSALVKYLLQFQDEVQSAGPRLTRPLRLQRRFMDYFFQPLTIDPDIAPWAEFFNPFQALEPILFGQEVQEELCIWWERYLEETGPDRPLFVIQGPPGSGKSLQIRHLCANYQYPLIIVDLSRMPRQVDEFSRGMQYVLRECLLTGSLAGFRGLESIMPESFPANQGSEHQISDERREVFIRTVEELPGPLFILVEEMAVKLDLPNYSTLGITLDIPGESLRQQIWETFSGDYRFAEEIDWGQMASKFRFTAGQIRNALNEARATTSSREANPPITLDSLHQACFGQGRHALSGTAARIKPVYTWEQLILPPETIGLLQNACNQMKYRYRVYGDWGFDKRLAYGKGLSMLFSGLPGTGKTMAAQVIAAELNLELFRIDLAQVVSKYIGETEKNLRRIFNEAQSSNAILFFDEADALFGKRSEVKDSHDRYANIEIAYLLQKVEEYEGISILATNLSKNMDEAFVRRITYIVEFPFPDAEYRKKIWKSMFPLQTPMHKDVDFDFLARRFEIAGGSIKNIAVASAFLAAQENDIVRMKYILRATKYEFKKTGRVLLKEDLGEYYNEI
ncbi:MAG: ATP-binding protein [Syntrophomonadaceae bacterium]|nr:ATP-binding protein [Syntrophomonadaceae bacterium]